jgi:hypothetical protein
MIFDKYIAKQKIDKVIFHLKKWKKEKYHLDNPEEVTKYIELLKGKYWRMLSDEERSVVNNIELDMNTINTDD